jgi:hypothetical protein
MEQAMMFGAMLILAIGATLLTFRLIEQPAPAVQLANTTVVRAPSRIFADEQKGQASVAEYAALGESYLPRAATTSKRNTPAVGRFADEQFYQASVAEYAALGEKYLPAAGTRTSHRAVVPRMFADEAASGATLSLVILPQPIQAHEISPVSGPR